MKTQLENAHAPLLALAPARTNGATIWYVVGPNEYEYAKCSVTVHLSYPWVRHVVLVYTMAAAPVSLGDLSKRDHRVREYWQSFGEGFEIPIEQGGFDQVSARNHALGLAELCNDKWLIQCDADEVFLDGLGDVLATSAADLLSTSVYHLTTQNSFWVRPDRIRYSANGCILYNPHRRIWRNGLGLRFVFDNGRRLTNHSRHCGPDCAGISESRIEDVPGILHLHFHHLLNKPGWDAPRAEGLFAKSIIPHQYQSLLQERGNPSAALDAHRLRLTTDAYVVNRDGERQLIYVPLREHAFWTDIDGAAIVEILKSGGTVGNEESSKPIIQQLTVIGALGSKDEPRPEVTPLAEFKPIEATLLFNESCNLGCTYCYASSVPSRGEMPWDIATAALRLVVENAATTPRRQASVRYLGGGEPTVSWDLVQRSTSYVRQYAIQHDVSVWIRLITNGTLIDRERSEWLRSNVDYVTLSFEILPELQKLRSYVGGASSHGRVLQTVRALIDSGIPFEIRCTVTEDFIGRMVEAVEYCGHLSGIREIRFEPVSNLGRARTAGVATPAQSAFTSEFLRARERGKELNINVRNKMTRNIDRIGPRFCEAEFAVGADGKVSGCHRFSRESTNGFDLFHFGEYKNGQFMFDVSRLNRLRGLSVHSFAECKNCYAKWNCAGECLSKRVSTSNVVQISGTTVSQNGNHCEIVRGVLAHMIEERLNGFTDTPLQNGE